VMAMAVPVHFVSAVRLDQRSQRSISGRGVCTLVTLAAFAEAGRLSTLISKAPLRPTSYSLGAASPENRVASGCLSAPALSRKQSGQSGVSAGTK
jgi:hypothetical protein